MFNFRSKMFKPKSSPVLVAPPSLLVLKMIKLKFLDNTCNNHHANRKNPLVVSFCRHIPKTHRSHTRHRKIQRCHIHRLPRGAIYKLRCAGVVRPNVRIRILGDIGQLPKPIILNVVIGVGASN